MHTDPRYAKHEVVTYVSADGKGAPIGEFQVCEASVCVFGGTVVVPTKIVP